MKWFGKIGYGIATETAPGVWENEFVEREYFGETKQINSHWDHANDLNDEMKINCQISIIADEFAYEQFPFIKYAEYNGHKWKVSDISPKHPRLILTLGGLYNGQ